MEHIHTHAPRRVCTSHTRIDWSTSKYGRLEILLLFPVKCHRPLVLAAMCIVWMPCGHIHTNSPYRVLQNAFTRTWPAHLTIANATKNVHLTLPQKAIFDGFRPRTVIAWLFNRAICVFFLAFWSPAHSMPPCIFKHFIGVHERALCISAWNNCVACRTTQTFFLIFFLLLFFFNLLLSAGKEEAWWFDDAKKFSSPAFSVQKLASFVPLVCLVFTFYCFQDRCCCRAISMRRNVKCLQPRYSNEMLLEMFFDCKNIHWIGSNCKFLGKIFFHHQMHARKCCYSGMRWFEWN